MPGLNLLEVVCTGQFVFEDTGFTYGVCAISAKGLKIKQRYNYETRTEVCFLQVYTLIFLCFRFQNNNLNLSLL
jgi:hypothetical protein